MKKLAIVVGVLVGLFILAIILVPMLVDVNKYRPQIEKVVEDNINGDLELGQLSLSLWPGVNIRIAKLVISEKGSVGKHPIVAFNDARLEIPFLSVFSGKPDITLSVKDPLIQVVNGKDGKLNVSKLSKASATPATPTDSKQSGGGGKALALPFQLSFHLVDGHFIYTDEVKNTNTEIKGINFDLKHFTLNKPFSFSFDSNLEANEMKDLTLKGNAKFSGSAAIYTNMQGLEKFELATNVDLSGLLLKYGTLLDKEAKAPLKLAVKLAATPTTLRIDNTNLIIEDAIVTLDGTVNNFDAPVVNLTVTSNKFIFDHWQKVIGPIKDYDMKGSASFNVKVEGPLTKLTYQGQASAKDMSLKAPGIVPHITNLHALLKFSNDGAAISDTGLKMGNSDLEVDGSINNFLKPVIVVNAKSQVLDVDSLLPKKSPEQEKAEEQAAQGQSDVDIEKSAKGPIAAMKKNPYARAIDFTAHAQIGKLKVHQAELTNLAAEMTFKDLVMSLKKASAKAFGGAGNFNSTIDFRGADPVYSAGGDVSGMDINAAVSSQVSSAKDTIFGKMISKFDVSGSGLSKAKVTQSLKGKGNFRLDNGSWSAFQVLKLVGDKLKSIPGISGGLAGIKLTDKFRDMHADFNIAGGHINITNMVADMESANTGLNGQGFVDFDMNVNIKGKILAPIAKGTMDNMRGSDGRVNLPYEVGCKVSAPCLNMNEAAQAALKSEAPKALKRILENNIQNPTVQGLLKKLPF